ncbi:recombinase family protein [Alicyclobacillus sp. SO9]|uniref:recombinase family protein n=1 Tax=Alicyclobacillus sp. SO9 TaxID=2665646 RepID=UPI0018E761F3|nr:recombinase family protein [Alicyclobacillus sp. SO9]QQE79625.1 recombinase family protein [Alicyclobacillus sp. SO9]
MSSRFPTDIRVRPYLRKSRADLEAEARGEGDTLSKHKRALMALVRQHRWTVLDIYEEVVSGERILDRPQMQRLLQDLEDGETDAVLCMDIDRLGRGNMIDQGVIQETFKQTETLIITPRKVYNLLDEMDEEWSEFEAFMARRELKIITRRMQRGRRDSSAEGKHVGRNPPYGYLRDENLKLYPDPDKAPVVQLIFELAAQGMGMTSICRRLTEDGVPTPTGRLPYWEESTLYSMLTNPVYRGHIVWGMYKNYKTTKNPSGRTKVKQPESNWVVHENAHEALVSDETYQKYLDSVQSKPRIPVKTELANPMAALLYCAECNHAMRFRPAYGGRKNRLLCTTVGCHTKSAAWEDVHNRMLAALRETFDGMTIDERMKHKSSRGEYSRVAVLENKKKAVESELAELDTQLNRLHDLLERGVYDDATYIARNRALGERISTSKNELTTIEEKIEGMLHEQHKVQELMPRIGEVLEGYESADIEKKNAMLRSILSKMTYRRKPEWKKSDQFELELFLRT